MVSNSVGSGTLTAVDCFSGAGGLSLGLKQAGFEIVAAFDYDESAVTTYQANLGRHVIEESVQNLHAEDLLANSGLDKGEVTLVAGGPPCQGFSLQRRGSHEDERNDLVLEFRRLVLEIEPQFFVMENVPGILSKRGRPYLERLVATFSDKGYLCQVQKLDAADFGVPQNRERVFIVGERRGYGRVFEFPEPTVTTPRTVADAFQGLPSPLANGKEHPEFPNHFRGRLSEANKERISFVPQGGGRLHIPRRLQLRCHKKNNGHRHLDVYGRLALNEPAGTITARFDSFTRGRFAHPLENRTITLREGARLQTFPDDFVFHGTKVEVARQIGNAVPPLVARVLGEAIRKAVERRLRGETLPNEDTGTYLQTHLPVFRVHNGV